MSSRLMGQRYIFSYYSRALVDRDDSELMTSIVYITI